MAFKFLAHADAEVTTENLDSEKIKSHKIETEKPTDEELKLPEYKKLETELREAYLQSMEEVVFLEKEKYQEEKTYSELGVFTKKAFKKAQIIPGLKGMTAFSPNTITIDTFSVLDKGRKNLERVMLGPASFINHACKPNADWVVQGEWSKTTLVVKTIRHIKKGEEITLSYGKHFFGVDNKDCGCTDCKDKKNGTEERDETSEADISSEPDPNLHLEPELQPESEREREPEQIERGSEREASLPVATESQQESEPHLQLETERGPEQTVHVERGSEREPVLSVATELQQESEPHLQLETERGAEQTVHVERGSEREPVLSVATELQQESEPHLQLETERGAEQTVHVERGSEREPVLSVATELQQESEPHLQLETERGTEIHVEPEPEPVYTELLPVNRDLMEFLDSQDLADFSDVNFAEMSAIPHYTPMEPFQFQQFPYMHPCPPYMEKMNYMPPYPQQFNYMQPFYPPMPPQPLIQQHPQPTNSTPLSAPKMPQDPGPSKKSTNCRAIKLDEHIECLICRNVVKRMDKHLESHNLEKKEIRYIMDFFRTKDPGRKTVWHCEECYRRFSCKKTHRKTCQATLQELENPSSKKSLPQSIRDKCKTNILAREDDVQVVERFMKQQQVLADMSEKNGPEQSVAAKVQICALLFNETKKLTDAKALVESARRIQMRKSLKPQSMLNYLATFSHFVEYCFMYEDGVCSQNNNHHMMMNAAIRQVIIQEKLKV